MAGLYIPMYIVFQFRPPEPFAKKFVRSKRTLMSQMVVQSSHDVHPVRLFYYGFQLSVRRTPQQLFIFVQIELSRTAHKPQELPICQIWWSGMWVYEPLPDLFQLNILCLSSLGPPIFFISFTCFIV